MIPFKNSSVNRGLLAFWLLQWSNSRSAMLVNRIFYFNCSSFFPPDFKQGDYMKIKKYIYGPYVQYL